MATSPPVPSLKIEDFPTLTDTIGDEADRLFRALNTALSTTAGQSSSALVMNNQAWQVKEITVTPKDDHKLASLQNNWTNFDVNAPTMYAKLDQGLIMMHGRLAPGVGSKGAVAFTVPLDYAPSATRYFITDAQGNANAEVVVGADGTLVINYNGAPTWVAVDNARWIAKDRHPELNPLFPMRVKLELGGRKARDLWCSRGRDLNGSSEGHVGNAVWADWYQDGDQLVIENISGLSPGRTFKLRFLILGA